MQGATSQSRGQRYAVLQRLVCGSGCVAYRVPVPPDGAPDVLVRVGGGVDRVQVVVELGEVVDPLVSLQDAKGLMLLISRADGRRSRSTWCEARGRERTSGSLVALRVALYDELKTLPNSPMTTGNRVVPPPASGRPAAGFVK